MHVVLDLRILAVFRGLKCSMLVAPDQSPREEKEWLAAARRNAPPAPALAQVPPGDFAAQARHYHC